MPMGITRVADQYGHLAEASAHREQLAVALEGAHELADAHKTFGITPGMNDPRRMAEKAREYPHHPAGPLTSEVPLHVGDEDEPLSFGERARDKARGIFSSEGDWSPADAYDWNRPDYDPTGDPYFTPPGEDPLMGPDHVDPLYGGDPRYHDPVR